MFRCESCLKYFATLRRLKIHENECKVYSQQPPSSPAFARNHLKIICEKIKVNKCGDCGKLFAAEANLNQHMRRTHQTGKEYSCDKDFSNLSNLNCRTPIVRDNKRNFICNLCDKAFGHKATLNCHVQTVHESERNFICNICDKAFGCKSTLNRHVQTVHENEKNFICNFCDKAFGCKSTLNCHVQTVHENERNFICNICDKAFGRKTNLNSHVQTVHENENS